MLGLGNRVGKTALITPGIVTDGLKLKHNYNAGSVVPVSDGAALFNGTSDTITCGSDSSIDDIFDGGGTVSAWIFALDIGENDYGRIIDKTDAASNPSKGWSIHIRDEAGGGTTAKLSMVQAWDSNDGIWATGNTAIVYNQWNHIAVTYNNAAHGNNPIFYINGALISVTESSTPTTDGTRFTDAAEVWTIGNRAGGTDRTWDGYICNVGAWEAILTQPQIKSIMFKSYADLTTSETTNLVSWWNIDEGTGTSVEDSHGSNDGAFA